jgi:hypothetical protein
MFFIRGGSYYAGQLKPEDEVVARADYYAFKREVLRNRPDQYKKGFPGFIKSENP